MKKQIIILAALFGLLLMVGLAQASLITTGTVYYDGADRNLIYDDDLDITWLDYSNRPTATWSYQVYWADNLSLTINGTTYDDWRLPNAGPNPQTGYDQTTSEMGHLFYNELGLQSLLDRTIYVTDAELNAANFDNLRTDYYHFGTVFADEPELSSWCFSMESGYQTVSGQSNRRPGLAVFDGQISSAVPIPGAIWLLGLGITGLSALHRKK